MNAVSIFPNQAKEIVLERATPAMVQLALRGMAAALRLRPSMRHHLKDTHPAGTEFVFRAKFLFATRDGRARIHAIFRDGKMSVGSGPIEKPDVTVFFRSLEHMRIFFLDGSRLFEMLLGNHVSFEGNLSYLAKFGHMSLAITKKDSIHSGKEPIGQQRFEEGWEALPVPNAGMAAKEVPKEEAIYLKDAYLSEYTLDDFPALKRLLWAHRCVQPEISVERPRLLTEFIVERKRSGTLPAHPGLRMALGLHHIMTGKRAIIHPDDRLAGTTTEKRIGVLLFPEMGATAIWPELLSVEHRTLNPYRISPEDIDTLNREVFPFWMEDNIREWTRKEYANPLSMRLEERFALYFIWKNHAVSHTIPDFPTVLSRGLFAIRDEARAKEKAARKEENRDFYRGLQVACEGVIDYARRLGTEANAQASQPAGANLESEKRREELREMARICEKVPAGPAESLREAIQAIWILFLALHQENTNAGLSVGRLDLWLQPYFDREMKAIKGAKKRKEKIEETIELIGALLLKMTDHLPVVPDIGNHLFGGSSSDQAITLGGQTEDGGNAVCDMTWIFLKATEMLRLRDPNMNARYAPGVNSEAYLKRLCEVNLLTHATPSIHNDDAMIPTLESQGFSLEHARDWAATGCVEPTSCGRHFGHTGSLMFNMVAPLEMALHDGFHPLLGETIGPRTGSARNFVSFEQVLEAYQTQLSWLIDQAVHANNLLGIAHQKLRPTPLLSSLFQGPMETGKDVIEGGAIYNSTGTAMVGLADVVDSLTAIKVLAFEKKRIDMNRLIEALENDFVGHEAVAAMLANKAPKFGDDHPLPKQIADDLRRFIFDCWQKQPHYRGGKYSPGYWSMSNHVAFGLFTGALPSGRKRGKAFTPGLTPSTLSRASLTENLRNVAGLDSRVHPNNIAYNVKVVPSAQDTHEETVDRMTAYAKAYFEMGGMQMQYNVVSTDTLKEAMQKPEEYRDLLVRISGYNAYFVELNRDMQIELIERTEHALGG